MKHIVTVAVASWLCISTLAIAQDPAPPEKTGAKVGAEAPSFKLKDQAGKPRTLDDLSSNVDYVALVFHRSASW